MLDYMNPNSTATLRAAVCELRRAEGSNGDMSSAGELTSQMYPHDVVHVLFACGTHLFGEVQAHLWMLLGTTARLADMHQTTQKKDHRAVLADIGHFQLLKTWLRAVPAALSIAWRSRKMTRAWPIDKLDIFLDRPLKEVRAEYGIQLPTAQAS